MSPLQNRTHAHPLFRAGLISLAVFAVMLAAAPAASAAGAEAAVIDQSPRLIHIAIDRAVTATLTVKNLSGRTWSATGANAVTLQALPDSSDALRHRWWRGNVIARLKAPVRPRGTATFRFPLQGGDTVAFAEEQVAVFAGARRLSGSTFTIAALVGEDGRPHFASELPSEFTVTLPVGTEQTLPIEAKNIGRQTWRNRGWNRVRLTPAAASATQFRASSWAAPSVVAVLPEREVADGGTTTINLPVRAPLLPGTYQEDYVLTAAASGTVRGGRVRVTINAVQSAILTSPIEPMVRVGLFARTTNPTIMVRTTGPASLTTLDGITLLPGITEVTLGKSGAQYTYTAGESTGAVDQPLRVSAPATTVLELVDWENRPSWDTTLNDNLVRGTVEWRTAANGKTWAINELPVEAYLLGLAETSARSPVEFRKTIVTAARTYALYHASRKTKHASENYDLNATTDQVYRGYAHEVRSPSVKQAVEATRGMAMFHPAARSELNPNGLIIAAYSACTDGRTRSFQERFGGDGTTTPYLISVPDPDGVCVNQRYLQGLDGNHMVGVSGNGGIAAAQAGKTYLDILAYYYTGVVVTKYYD